MNHSSLELESEVLTEYASMEAFPTPQMPLSAQIKRWKQENTGLIQRLISLFETPSKRLTCQYCGEVEAIRKFNCWVCSSCRIVIQYIGNDEKKK